MTSCLLSQIFVQYPVPNDTKVLLNSRPNGTMIETDDNDGGQDVEELFCACSLKHLPPLVLTCLLPRSYPSTCPPYFTISARWLDGSKVSYLCAMFDEIWTELPGQEVVYRWVDWLNVSSWSCISSNDNILLVPDADVADERAIARRLLVDDTISLMQNYSEKRSQEIFLKSLHECGICLSENTGKSLIPYLLCLVLLTPLSFLQVSSTALWSILLVIFFFRNKIRNSSEEAKIVLSQTAMAGSIKLWILGGLATILLFSSEYENMQTMVFFQYFFMLEA